jgi:hypothetical protein
MVFFNSKGLNSRDAGWTCDNDALRMCELDKSCQEQDYQRCVEIQSFHGKPPFGMKTLYLYQAFERNVARTF